MVRAVESPDATAALKAQVLALQESERAQAAELGVLKQRLSSFELEVRQGGQTKRRRLLEETPAESEVNEYLPVAKKEEGGEEKIEGEALEKEGEEGVEGEESKEGEEGEEEEEEEEEVDPVDLTLAISLLGFITIIMALFWLVNYDDQDMKIYIWGVLSNTLSIFLAVLMFTTLSMVVHRFVPEDASTEIVIFVDFMQLAFCFVLMQFAVAYISGCFEKQPFGGAGTEGMTISEQKQQRVRRFKSVATLLAHSSGFAAINFGGAIQHMKCFLDTPLLMFVVPPALFVFQLIACRLVRRIRTNSIKNILANNVGHAYQQMSPVAEAPVVVEEQAGCTEQMLELAACGTRLPVPCPTQSRVDHASYQQISPVGAVQMHPDAPPDVIQEKAGVEWCVEKWEEETYESENEISSLAISFLLLQAIRYNLTGVMPDAFGIEEENYTHPKKDIYYLTGCGLILAVCCCIIVVVTAESFPENVKIPGGTVKSMVKRMCLIGQGTTAMGFAWALMYTSKWQLTILTSPMNPNCVTARVMLAVCISVIAFFIILGLDHLADMKSTGEKTDKAIIAIITSLSILVGFTWEQSFDGAVEVLADSKFKEHKVMAVMTLTVAIFTIVYPQWRKYILRTLLRLKDEKEAQEAKGEGS